MHYYLVQISPIIINNFSAAGNLKNYQYDNFNLRHPCFSVPNIKDSVSFTSVPNSEKLRKLFAYQIPCMYSGITMIDPKQVQKLINTKIFKGPAINAVKALEPFKESMFRIEREVFEILKEKAEISPKKNLSEILKSLVPENLKLLREKQRPIFNSLKETAECLPENLKAEFNLLMENTEKKLNNEPVIVPFSTYEFKFKLNKLNKTILNINDKKEINAMKKIMHLASHMNDETNNLTKSKHNHILRQISHYMEKSPLSKNKELKSIIDISFKRIHNIPIDVPFNRKSFLYDLQKITDKINDKELQNKFYKTASLLPTSRQEISAFILKSADNKSEKIAYRLISGSMASVEHLKPAAKKGADELFNYGPACVYYNSDRGDKDFLLQLQEHPETSINSQKCIDRLIELYNNGTFDKIGLNRNYIINFRQSVFNLSAKKLDLDISKLAA